ncbi:hypothetical protein OIU34_23440 [Pararhizobium sp. BT-229]|uniref:hypothetical protein n=1 Tax=Pararhizobium sp. BT-229 TaxID=2986923 RepID=UPI0021F763B8|nr:hypothetical protein [Pararhizobium sp. BT-229]MCV9964851.1 hypothetical protein [Pararhizobium sp. BT-229]
MAAKLGDNTMRIGHGHQFALVIHHGTAKVGQVRKNRGPGHSVLLAHGTLDCTEYQDNLDVFEDGTEDGTYLDTVHVVASAPRAEELPLMTSLVIPDRGILDAALPAIRSEINSARLSKQMKDYLNLMLAEHNRVTVAFPFMAQTKDSVLALKMAMQKMAAWEASLFSGMETRIKETLGSTPEQGGRQAAEFAARVQGAARSAADVENPRSHEDSQQQCKDDLKKLLAETRQKIADIDRRLLACGPAPHWRDSMNEVFYAATQVSRTLDYIPDEPRPAGPRRR